MPFKTITPEEIDHWFTYHAPGPEDLPKFQAIREAGKQLAKVILENTPCSADQYQAIRKVREAVFNANAAIACKGQ